MKAWLVPLVAVLALVSAQPAFASLILDCQMTGTGGAPPCTSGGPYGEITLTDVGNSVQFSVDMFTGTDTTVVSLNYHSGYFDPSGWTISGGTINQIGNDASGYNGLFDIRNLPSTLSDPWVFTLAKSGVDLNPSDFLYKDETSTYYAVVRTTGTAPEGNFYGSTSVVPEPSTLLLLGSGLMGFVAYRRIRG